MHQALHVERSIEAHAARQFGVFGRTEAVALGATRAMLDHRRDCGRWVLTLPGVYRVAAVPESLGQRAMAACFWGAPDGLISHETAAVLWGFEGMVCADVHLIVPTARRLRSEVVTVHRAADLLPADVATKGPLRLTSPLRTAVDLAGSVDVETLEIAIESALRRRQFSPGQLRWRAEALGGRGRRGSADLAALLARRTLGKPDSRREVRTAQILTAAGLPPPTRQHQVRANGRRVARVDLAYPDEQIAIEYDSDAWHHGVARRHRDAERRNALRALGWVVIEVTPAMLRDPAGLVGAIVAVRAGQVGGIARRKARRSSSS